MMTSKMPGRLLAGLVGAVALVGAGGVMLGRTAFAPHPVSTANAAEGDEAGHADDGLVEMDAARAAAAGIQTERIAPASLIAEILGHGNVVAAPDGEALLTARAEGTVSRITKRLGDPVVAGEIIAYLESRDAAAIAAERSTAASRATAARQAFARERRLFDAKVTARQDLEAAQALLAEAEAELRRTQAAAIAAGISGNGRFIAVSSLISGRISKADARLGAHVPAGAELFRVVDPGRMQIEAAVPARDATRIRPGDRAMIDGATGAAIPATVRSTTPGLNPASRTATILLVADDGHDLQTGQGVRVRITPRGAVVADRVVVPEEAVQSIDGRNSVFVRTSAGFRVALVVTGQRNGGRVEIVSGINPGAVIATRGAFLLKAERGKGEAEH